MDINVGDKVSVVKTEDAEGEYEVGDILTISRIEPVFDSDIYWVEEFESPFLFDFEFEKVEVSKW